MIGCGVNGRFRATVLSGDALDDPSASAFYSPTMCTRSMHSEPKMQLDGTAGGGGGVAIGDGGVLVMA